jgi:hypothetical protein
MGKTHVKFDKESVHLIVDLSPLKKNELTFLILGG